MRVTVMGLPATAAPARHRRGRDGIAAPPSDSKIRSSTCPGAEDMSDLSAGVSQQGGLGGCGLRPPPPHRTPHDMQR